jgi:hypothetical protein
VRGVADLPLRRGCFTWRAWQSRPSPQTAALPRSSVEIERCVIATFRTAESLGFKGDFRQWKGATTDRRLIREVSTRGPSLVQII